MRTEVLHEDTYHYYRQVARSFRNTSKYSGLLLCFAVSNSVLGDICREGNESSGGYSGKDLALRTSCAHPSQVALEEALSLEGPGRHRASSPLPELQCVCQ